MRHHFTLAAALLAFAVSGVAASPNVMMNPTPDPKFSCKLSPEQLHKQREELLPGLFKRAAKLTDLADGLRLHLIQHSGLLAELARIIEREQDCCSFLTFHITVEASGGPVTFDITGPAGTREMLKSL